MSCGQSSFLYSLWRRDCQGTLYPENKTSVTADVLEAGFLYAAACLAVSALVVIPGIRGKKKWFVLLRSFLVLFILTNIMLCNYGQEWEVASSDVVTPYRAGIDDEIHAHIEVKIGLRSINVSLKADPEIVLLKNASFEEKINYNERFHWDNLGWNIGRFGFGVFAGRFNREFREGQRKGLPYPILWVAEYFTADGEGLRWGRHYLQAGFYAHILIWSAFPLWIITVAMTNMVLLYSGIGSLLTGVCLLMANILFASVRNRNELSGAIPFDKEDGSDVHLVFVWGWAFWLNVVNGFICVIIGIVIIVLDFMHSRSLTTFFDINILEEYDLVYADPSELIKEIRKSRLPRTNDITRTTVQFSVHDPQNNSSDSESDYEDVSGPLPRPQFRRRGHTNAASLHRIIGKKGKKLQPGKKVPANNSGNSGGENARPNKGKQGRRRKAQSPTNSHHNAAFEGDSAPPLPTRAKKDTNKI